MEYHGMNNSPVNSVALVNSVTKKLVTEFTVTEFMKQH